jgi:hypothetical protein
MAELPSHTASAIRPDNLNQLNGVLIRREVEARLLAPLLTALGLEFGEGRILPAALLFQISPTSGNKA